MRSQRKQLIAQPAEGDRWNTQRTGDEYQRRDMRLSVLYIHSQEERICQFLIWMEYFTRVYTTWTKCTPNREHWQQSLCFLMCWWDIFHNDIPILKSTVSCKIMSHYARWPTFFSQTCDLCYTLRNRGGYSGWVVNIVEDKKISDIFCLNDGNHYKK